MAGEDLFGVITNEGTEWMAAIAESGLCFGLAASMNYIRPKPVYQEVIQIGASFLGIIFLLTGLNKMKFPNMFEYIFPSKKANLSVEQRPTIHSPFGYVVTPGLSEDDPSERYKICD